METQGQSVVAQATQAAVQGEAVKSGQVKPQVDSEKIQTQSPEKKFMSPLEQFKAEKENEGKDDIDGRFAALKRKEMKFQEEMIKHKREIEAQRQEMEKYKKYAEYENKVKEDPRLALDAYGLTMEQLQDAMIKDPEFKDPRYDSLQQELKTLKEERDAWKKQQDEQVLEKGLEQFKGSIKQVISENADKYELVNIHGDEAIEDVFKVCEEYFNETGSHLELDKADEYVENVLEKQVSKFKTSKKLGFASSIQNGDHLKMQSKQISPTLTNSAEFTASKVETLNPEERMRMIAQKYKK